MAGVSPSCCGRDCSCSSSLRVLFPYLGLVYYSDCLSCYLLAKDKVDTDLRCVCF